MQNKLRKLIACLLLSALSAGITGCSSEPEVKTEGYSQISANDTSETNEINDTSETGETNADSSVAGQSDDATSADSTIDDFIGWYTDDPNLTDEEFFSHTLFVGDSIFTGIDGYGYLPSRNVFAKVGLSVSGGDSVEINGRKLYDIAGDFDMIVIMLGTNELNGNNTSEVVTGIESMIDKIRTENPNTDVFFLTLPPVAEVNSYPNMNNETIREFNAAIKELSQKRAFKLIDLHEALSDANGYLSSEFSEADGVHLKGSAYKTILSLVRSGGR
ncbi:MAG: GDSL-type esterase/lipase family protein [Oscillospiraceae bacterium]|nr:GDSL-type esterase/lipase family protein [Oscillospiraceae bacterium]